MPRTPIERIDAHAPTYQETLARARKVGAARATDPGLIALFCASPALQQLCGAVSASLVFAGSQAKGLTFQEFARLAHDDPSAIEALMWL